MWNWVGKSEERKEGGRRKKRGREMTEDRQKDRCTVTETHRD